MPRENLFRCPPLTRRGIIEVMGENETRSEFKNIAVALVRTLAVVGFVCGSMWATAIVLDAILREYTYLEFPAAFLCELTAAAAVGVFSVVFVRWFFRR